MGNYSFRVTVATSSRAAAVRLHLHERLALLLEIGVLQQLLRSFLGAHGAQPPARQGR